MLDFTILPLPLIIITIGNFFLSWIWYSPILFAKPWAKALGFDMSAPMSEEAKKKMPILFLSGLVSSLLLALGLQVLIHSLKVVEFGNGALVGAIAWATFALTHSLNTLWEERKPIVLAVNNGLFLLSYAGFGGLVAVWH